MRGVRPETENDKRLTIRQFVRKIAQSLTWHVSMCPKNRSKKQVCTRTSVLDHGGNRSPRQKPAIESNDSRSKLANIALHARLTIYAPRGTSTIKVEKMLDGASKCIKTTLTCALRPSHLDWRKSYGSPRLIHENSRRAWPSCIPIRSGSNRRRPKGL
jgi:hypothetical protein